MADQTLDETLLTHGSTSPFLPDTFIQFAWDSTCLGMIKTCPRLYQYTMIDGYVAKGESIHLRFGQEYHQALQDYDIARAEGIDHEDAIHSSISELVRRTHDWSVDETVKPGKYKNRQTLVSLVLDYLDHYVDDPAETYIKSDGKPAVELSFRFELDWGPTSYHRCTSMKSADGGSGGEQVPCDGRLSPYTGERIGGCDEPCSFVMDTNSGELVHQPYLLCGHMDRVVTFNDQLFVMDHKTTVTTPSQYYFDQYEPHNQMTLYTIAGQVVLNAPVKGVIVRAAQILLEKEHRFVSGFTLRTADQLDEWMNDLRLHLERAEDYATRGYWPMNDTSCNNYGGCKFRGICSKSPSVREIYLKSDFEQLPHEERWNPLRSR